MNQSDKECNKVVNGALHRENALHRQSYNKNLTKVVMWRISDHQLEELAKKHLGIEFDFVADECVGNHYTPFFNMVGYKRGDNEDIYASYLIENLIYLGVLEPGSYLVDHTW
jgi:hypothetical protein